MKQPSTFPSEVALLNAITNALSQYITESDPYILFSGLLETLLDLTDSEYGFIGEVFQSQNGDPYIKNYATTNIAWDEATQKLYEASKKNGMQFSKLDSLYGAVLKSGQSIISNNPGSDPRSCGIPHGHPPLNSFMGLPFYGGGKMLGMVGIANRSTGYQQPLADALNPFLMTCGNLIQAYHRNMKHLQVQEELDLYRARLKELDQGISLGNGYLFDPVQPSLTKHSELVPLTRKELSLLTCLVENHNNISHYHKLESHLWPNSVVTESSLRSLVRRLRQKLPELDIKTVSGIGHILIVPND